MEIMQLNFINNYYFTSELNNIQYDYDEDEYIYQQLQDEFNTKDTADFAGLMSINFITGIDKPRNINFQHF